MSVAVGQNGVASDVNNLGHFIAGEALSTGDAVSLNYADYKIYKASAAAFDHRLNFIGFCIAGVSSGAAVNVNVLTVVNEKTGLTANTDYYLSDTQGAISTSAGTYHRIIGRAVTTSKLLRKRGVVSKPFNAGTGGTVPCDGYFNVKSSSNAGSTRIITDGVSIDFGTSATGIPARMGTSYSCNYASGGALVFVVFDFGGFM